MPYEIKMVMNYAKHKKFVRFIQNKASHGLRNMIAVLAAGLIAGGILVYLGLHQNIMFILIIGIVLIAAAAGYTFCMALYYNSQVKKGWNVKHTVAGEIRVRVVLHEDRLMQITNYAKTELFYNKVKKAYETGEFIYLMISDKRAVIIEKKACSKEALAFLKETFNYTGTFR